MTSGFITDNFFIMEECNNFIKKLKSFLKNENYKTIKNKNLIKVKKEEHTAFLEIVYPYYENDAIKIGLFYKNGILLFVSSVDKEGITFGFEDKELLKKGKISIAKNLTKKTEYFFTKEEYFFFKKLAEDIKDFFLPNSIRFIEKL